jgi:hypothetical protein
MNDLIVSQINADATLLFHDVFSKEEGKIIKG